MIQRYKICIHAKYCTVIIQIIIEPRFFSCWFVLQYLQYWLWILVVPWYQYQQLVVLLVCTGSTSTGTILFVLLLDVIFWWAFLLLLYLRVLILSLTTTPLFWNLFFLASTKTNSKKIIKQYHALPYSHLLLTQNNPILGSRIYTELKEALNIQERECWPLCCWSGFYWRQMNGHSELIQKHSF